jgi:colanic acid biosynthesis protein WcaH
MGERRQSMLPENVFKGVIESTPLISIDLIVRNDAGKVLLGKRLNRPARGYWFVPGGRVLKDETIESAFSRLVKQELGCEKLESTFKGVYEHFYDDNFYGESFSTHYIVLAYEVIFNENLHTLPLEQHSKYKWFTQSEILESEMTHEHSKWYFQKNKQADFHVTCT